MARIAGTTSDSTRLRILDAARVEYTERTYAGTTIRHIADTAGITTAALYYLFASKGACCQGANSTYRIVVGRSASITGPYVDKAGVAMMSGGGTVLASSGTRFKGPGGQSLLSDGSVMAWHAYDADNGGAPVLFINNVTWGSDGWPQPVW